MNDTVYENLEKFVLSTFDRKLNSVIVSVPGVGVGHELNKICSKHNFTYIVDKNDTFGNKNIIDIDFHNGDATIESSLLLFEKNKKTDPKNFFCFVIDAPQVITTDTYKKSDLSAHIWDYYYMKVRTLEETDYLLHTWEFNYSEDQVKRIHDRSNGVTRLIKYFANFPDSTEKSNQELFADETFVRIFLPSLQVVSKLDTQTQIKLGLDPKNELFIAGANETTFISDLQMNLKINDDLSFIENNKDSETVLSLFEAELLKTLLDQSVITRDHIAQLKWGDNYADKFSDQAINQAIARLNDKLSNHIVKAVSKLGYKLATK